MTGGSPTGGSDFAAGWLAAGAANDLAIAGSAGVSGAKDSVSLFRGGRVAGMKPAVFSSIFFETADGECCNFKSCKSSSSHAPGEFLNAVSGTNGPRDKPDARHDGQADDQHDNQKNLIHNRVLSGRPCRRPARSGFNNPIFTTPLCTRLARRRELKKLPGESIQTMLAAALRRRRLAAEQAFEPRPGGAQADVTRAGEVVDICNLLLMAAVMRRQQKDRSS